MTAVPALLKMEDSAKALKALAADLDGLDRGAQVQEALRRIAATTACHAAVKANDPLTWEKMTHILEELRATAYSTVCPHGRPVMLRLTRREIEKNFDTNLRRPDRTGGGQLNRSRHATVSAADHTWASSAITSGGSAS